MSVHAEFRITQPDSYTDKDELHLAPVEDDPEGPVAVWVEDAATRKAQATAHVDFFELVYQLREYARFYGLDWDSASASE